MAAFSKAFRLRRSADRLGPRRLMVLDLGSSSTKVVVLSRSQQTVRWEQALVWPRLADDLTFGDGLRLPDMIDKDGVDAEYVSAIVSSGGVLLRLLNFPGRPGSAEAIREQVRQTLGVDEHFTVQSELVQQLSKDSGGRDEYSVFAAAMPGELVEKLYSWLIESKLKPVSLRVSGVATANLINSAPGLLQAGKALGVVEIGSGSSLLLLYQGTDLALARQFKFGASLIIENLKSAFELDSETATKFFSSGSFDFSANVASIVTPWLHQLAISLDFFERRYGKTVGSLYLFGGGAQSRVVESMVSEHVKRPVLRWNPLEAMPGLEAPALSGTVSADLFALALDEGLRMIRSGESHAV